MTTATEAIKGTAEFANDFMPVFREAASSAEREKARLLEELAAIQEQRKLLDDKAASVEKAIAELEANVLVGLKLAAREAGVKLDVTINKNNENVGSDNNNKRKRTGRAEIAKASSKILDVMPKNKIRFFDGLRKDTGLDVKVCRSVLQKLKREGKVKTNGMRGPGAGWLRT